MPQAAVLAGLLVAVCLTSLGNYLLFHSLAEFFSIVIACGIFITAWNTRWLQDNSYLLFVGIAYLFIGGIDLAHTLAYKGMGVFERQDTDLATQLWIAARYVESITLLIAPLFLSRRLSVGSAFVGYALVTAALLAAVFTDLFPDCHIEGQGITLFKRLSEYTICLILWAALWLLFRHRRGLDASVLRLMELSILATVAAELAFTFYVSVYGLSNLIGHVLKIISFFFIYKAIIETGLTKPYALLFRNLKHSEERLKSYAALLEQRNEEIKQFAYIVSHDLRAPLATLKGFTDELRTTLQVAQSCLTSEWADLDASQQQAVVRTVQDEIPGALDFIESSAGRMDDFTSALLGLSRLGRQELRPERIDMIELVHGTLKTLAHQIEEKQANVTVAELPEAVVDRTAMEQIMANLLTNAVRYLDPQRPGQISVSGERGEEETTFSVKDNGRGISEDHLSNVFAPFRRAGHEDVPGEGMGLASVQTIVRRHAGRIWCESEEGSGTTFFFTISNNLPQG